MSEKMKFWYRVAFWENTKRTIAIFGAPGVIGLHEFGAADHWVMVAGGFSMLGAVLAIWCTDHNKNGVVDFFEE